jgi:hypothetical protein
MTKRKSDAPATVQAQADALLDTAVSRVDEAVAAVREAHAAIVRELEARREELRAARSVSSTRAEAVEQVDRLVSALAAGARVPEALRRERVQDAVEQLAEVSAARLLAVLAPSLVRDGLLAPLDAAAAERGGWGETPPEARRAEVERLEFMVLELETAEARAVAAARRSGVDLADFPPLPRPPREAGTYNSRGERIG